MYEEPSNVQELPAGFPITSKHNSVRDVQNRRSVQNTTQHSNTPNYASLIAVTGPGEQTKPSAYDAIFHQDLSVKGVSSSQYYEPYTVVGSGYDIIHPSYTTLPQDSAYTEMSSHPRRKRRTKRRHHSRRHGRLRTHSKDHQNYPGLTGIDESGIRSRHSSVSRTSNRRYSRHDNQSQQNTYNYPVLADITESRRRSKHSSQGHPWIERPSVSQSRQSSPRRGHRGNNTRLSISSGIAHRRTSRHESQSQSTTHHKRRRKSQHARGQSRHNSQSEYNRVTSDVRVSMSGREQHNTAQNYAALNEETDRRRQNIITPQQYANNKVHPA